MENVILLLTNIGDRIATVCVGNIALMNVASVIVLVPSGPVAVRLTVLVLAVR